MNHPFKVGDRVLDTLQPRPATVTELTAKGFKYKLDEKHYIGSPYFGYTEEGEVFEEGFKYWQLIK